ncbi:MAG: ComF family protein [Lachnospiraceae bacterium]|nr:ComF family protein [Lachnospiraceae bacterium]
MKRWFDKYLEILFPRKCPVCDDIIATGGGRNSQKSDDIIAAGSGRNSPEREEIIAAGGGRNSPEREDNITLQSGLICPECIRKIHFVREPACKKCGKEIFDERVEYCSDCVKHRHDYEWGVPLMNYDAVGRKIIADFKYHNRRDNADFLAEEIYKRAYGKIRLMGADALVPVPMYFLKKRIRGFNQSEVLAKRLGTLLNIPVNDKILIRNRNTSPQKNLEQTQRINNLKKAFKANDIPHSIKSVILVDDIYTTGSTVNACARVLKEAGVEKVYFICACIGRNT